MSESAAAKSSGDDATSAMNEEVENVTDDLAAASVSERLLTSRKAPPSAIPPLESASSSASNEARQRESDESKGRDEGKTTEGKTKKEEQLSLDAAFGLDDDDDGSPLTPRTKIGEDGKERELTKEELVEEALNCPCIATMKEGPCGQEFLSAYKCFLVSEAEPQGMDCVQAFQSMQQCMAEHPEEYNLDDLENDRKEAEERRAVFEEGMEDGGEAMENGEGGFEKDGKDDDEEVEHHGGSRDIRERAKEEANEEIADKRESYLKSTKKSQVASV